MRATPVKGHANLGFDHAGSYWSSAVAGSPRQQRSKSPAKKSAQRPSASPARRRPATANGSHDVESPPPKNEADDKYAAKQTGLAGDWKAILLLLLLYTLQGIPMGLGASLPMLMQEKKVSTMEQAVFSVVAYPFAFKLAWAPLVDSVFSSSFGRRKTWIVPAQLAIGLLLIVASMRVNALLGSDGPVDVKSLTALFFSFYFLCATQDIAVDGWALTILSERNKEYGATCNAIGQTVGCAARAAASSAARARGPHARGDAARAGTRSRTWASWRSTRTSR